MESVKRKRRKKKAYIKRRIIFTLFLIAICLMLWGMVLIVKSIFNSAGLLGEAESIGTRRELFWDEYLIDTEKTTAVLTAHSAQKKEIVFETNMPWEGNIADGFNIINDSGIYRMYYLTYTSENDARLCYAQSSDGLIWDKPQLNIINYDGNTDNNILINESYEIANGFYAFLDTNPSVREEEKYKAIAVNADNCLVSYTSANAIQWSKGKTLGKKFIAGKSLPINLNTAFYSLNNKLYYCYFVKTENDEQVIYVTTSKNFKSWSSPKRIEYQKDAAQFAMQTANISNYYRAPQVFFGLPLRSTEIDTESANIKTISSLNLKQEHRAANTAIASRLTDTVFITSRNGSEWNLNEEAWLSSGAEHDINWIYGDSCIANGMIETNAVHSETGEDNELSLYVAENQYSQEGTRLRRHTLRVDGFASYKSTYNTQKVVTRPIRFEGSRMTMNFSTSPNGYVFVRILDKNGKPFKPVSYMDAQNNAYEVPEYTSYELFGDRVDREVAFNADLSALKGKTVILEFYMSDADIYSFKFDNLPYENTAEWQPIEIPIRNYDTKLNYEGLEAVANIGSDRQLLWDSFIVNEAETTAVPVAHSPVRNEEIFKTDLPWEGNNCDFYVIVDDEDESGQAFYRMYYLGWDESAPTDIRVCYAYSYDGSEWIKPNLGIHSYTDKATGETYTQTNIMLYTEEKIFDNFFVMKDNRPNIPEKQRYKAIAQGEYDQNGFESYGLWAWTSSDGIHWKKIHRVLPSLEEWFGAFDSVNTLLWDDATQQFFTFFRVREPQSLNGVDFTEFRKIKGAVGQEFAPFDTSTIFELSYGENAPVFEMYTNNISKYYRAPQMFFGFPTRFNRRFEWAKNYEYLASPSHRQAGYSSGQVTKYLSMTEALFMTSRDGYNWNRQNEAWLTPGPEHEANWIYGNCYPAYGLIETETDNAGQDKELSTYIFEGKFYKAPSVLYRYTMRVDGFKGYKASYSPQTLTTKPFIFSGDNLLLNFKTSGAGSISIQILDASGNPIQGYASGKIIGDRVDRAVIFEKPLTDLNGQTIIMEFTMSDAEVYSFKFE